LPDIDIVEGTVFMWDLDMDADTLTMGLDGTWGTTVDITPSQIGGTIFGALSALVGEMRMNFGQSAFPYPPPPGARAGLYTE
jgi:hypothetical protein